MPNTQFHYDFNEHKHRYAVWTAARAVQRSFTSTDNINDAIKQTSLRKFAERSEAITQDMFDEMQADWCAVLIAKFNGMKVPCTYGRASKIIAIYLKTSIILTEKGDGLNCDVIHPPIDRILLKALSKDVKGLQGVSKKGWTQYERKDYQELFQLLRNHNLPFNWRLEQYWKPEQEKQTADEAFL